MDTVINSQKLFLLEDSFESLFINKSDFYKWRENINAKASLRKSNQSFTKLGLRDQLLKEITDELKILDSRVLIDKPTHRTLVILTNPINGKKHKPSEVIDIYKSIIKLRIKTDDISGYNKPECKMFEYETYNDLELRKIFIYCLKNGFDSIYIDRYLITGLYGGIHKLFGSMMNGIILYYHDDNKILTEVNIRKEINY